MNYLKFYGRVHLKYWWVYLLSVVTSFYGCILSLMLIWIVASLGMNDIISWVLGVFIGVTIMSSPVLYINYKVAMQYLQEAQTASKRYVLTVCNQIPAFVIYGLIYFVIMYW